FSQFEVAEFKEQLVDRFRTFSWEEYALKRLLKALEERHTSPQLLPEMLESLKNDPQIMAVLIGHLERLDQRATAQQIRQQLANPKTFTVGRLRIEESSNGYVAQHSRRDSSAFFTNFLVRVDHNIWFGAMQETYHRLRVILGGKEFPFLISDNQ